MRPSAVPPRARRAPLSLRLVAAALVAATGLTCRDGSVTGPGLPGRSVLAVSPRFAAPAAGGPQIILKHVTGTLKSRGGAEVVHAEASFEGDSAVLEFALTIFGPSELFEISISASDSTGEVVFGRSDTLRLRAGDNPTIPDLALDFVAPDTAAVSLALAPSLGVVEGETVTLTALALTADESTIAVRAGWISRDPTIADVTAQGVLTARTIGSTWVVATSFTGLRDSVLVGVRLPAATKLWEGGDAAGSTDWQIADNWIPAGVPTATDVVQIRATSPLRPALTVPASISGLILQSTTGLDLGANSLTISGKLDATGPIVGTGVVIATGATLVRGMLPNLEVRGVMTLVGTTSVAGRVKVTGTAADLQVGAYFLDVLGNLLTDAGGAITMRDPLGKIHVAGDASFLGGSTSGKLTDGVLEVHGAFTVGGPDTTVFMATDRHRVILDGTAKQTVVMDNRGPVGHRFQNLEIRNPQGATLQGVGVADTLRIASSVAAPIDLGDKAHVQGPLLLEAPVALRSAGPVTVGGTFQTVAGSSIALGELTLDAPAGTTGVAGGFSVPRVRFRAGTHTIKSSLPYGDVEVFGRGRIDGPTDVGGHLKVGALYADSGQFLGNGDLTTAGFPLHVRGDMSVMNATLTMVSASDSVHVDGNVTFEGGDSRGRLTDGVLVIGGNFTAGMYSPASFAASGNHRVVLAGTARQTASLALPGPAAQHFARLVVANPRGVLLDRLWTSGDLTIDAAAGDSVLLQGDPNTIGGRLSVAGPVAVVAGYGRLAVAGDVASVPGSILALTVLEIGGSAGTTLVDGGGYQVQRTVLTGAGQPLAANVTYDDVEIRGTAQGLFGGEVGPSIGGSLIVAGATASYDVNGLYLPVGGDLRVEQGATIIMTKPGDGISVTRNVFFDSGDLTGKLTEGAIFVGGNFEVSPSPGPTFVSTGNHIVQLDGRDSLIVQQVKLGSPGAGLQQLRRVHVSGTSEVVFHTVFITDTLSTDPFTTLGGRVSLLGTTIVDGMVDLQGSYTLGGLGTMMVKGDFQSGSASAVTASVLKLGGISGTTLAGGSFSPGRLVLVGNPAGPQPLEPSLVYQHVDVQGDALIAYRGAGMPATIAGDLSIAGPGARLDVNMASLTIGGDLVVFAGGSLAMRTTSDIVSVARRASFDDARTDSSLTGGMLRLAGDLTVTGGPGSFAPSGGHITELSGSIDQAITFSAGGPLGHRFWNLALNNSGFVRFFGIYAAGTVSMSDAAGGLDFSGFNEIAGSFGVINNKPLTGTGTLRIGPDFQTSSGVDVRIARLELTGPGGTLGVTGSFSPDTVVFRGAGSTIQMGLGYRTVLVMGQAAFEPRTTKTIIAGDLWIDDPESKTLGSAQLVVNGASDVTVSGDLWVGEFGRLIQTNQLDRLSVDGKARFEGYMPAGSLTAGVLAVKREVEIRAGSVFVADATHRLVLDGTALQTILVEGAGIPQEGGQALGSVQLTNRAQPGVLFISAGHLQGDLTLDPDTHLVLEKDRRVYVAGNLFDEVGTTIDIPNTATSELSVLNIMLQRHTALQKPVTNRLGAP